MRTKRDSSDEMPLTGIRVARRVLQAADDYFSAEIRTARSEPPSRRRES